MFSKHSNNFFTASIARIFIFVALSASSVGTYAQLTPVQVAADPQKPVTFYLYVGAAFSSFSSRIGEYGSNMNFDSAPRISLSLGLVGKVRLLDNLYLQPEIAFSPKGGAYRQENTSVVVIGGQNNDNKAYYYKKYALNYLEFPVLLNFSPPTNGRLGVDIGVGLAPAINISSSFKYNVFTTQSSSGPWADVDESYKTTPFPYAKPLGMSFVAQAGMSMPFFSKGGRSFIALRYANMFTSAFKVETLNSYKMKTTTNTVSLLVGFSI